MGHPKQCPICNRFGSPSLDGYCKICYPNRHNMEKQEFLERVFKFQELSVSVVKGALLEVGVNTVDEVKAEDRRTVVNICQRRLPQARNRYLVQNDTIVGEGDYFGIRKTGEADGDYRVEKGEHGLEDR